VISTDLLSLRAVTAIPPAYTLRRPAGCLEGEAERRGGVARAALEGVIAGGFALAFQPVVRLADRVIDHHEALLRAPPLPAAALLAAAEAFGREAALDLAVMRALPPGGGVVSVNLCARSFQAPGFAACVLDALGARPIRCELTHLAAIDDLAAVAAGLAELRAGGVVVALDAVDGGPAALACLGAARFDALKLAGGVVRAAAAGERGRRLLAELLRLAATMDAVTIATQVETLPQAWAMQAAGIPLAQGWLFGAPAQSQLM
jgi:EAL domain-containing protein (putative c-di-GMP-specific phosphodiesterase class I)